MKMFIDPSEVFLHRDFVDFRKAINGLAAQALYSFFAIKPKTN
jgi:hypothetical protein